MLASAQDAARSRGDDPADVEIDRWTIHDLRRTMATGMARLEIPPHVIEACLNHSSGSVSGIAKIYNRHNYADAKCKAFDAWAGQAIRNC